MAEFEHIMAGVALRNGRDAARAPSDDDFFDDLAAVYRAEVRG